MFEQYNQSTPKRIKKPRLPRPIPVIVRSCLIILENLAKTRPDERGYSIYFLNKDDYIVFEDVGQGLLTTSEFAYRDYIDPETLKYLVSPSAVYLLHTHPFQDVPTPSSLDLDTARRFREHYLCPVYCCVIGRKGRRWY